MLFRPCDVATRSFFGNFFCNSLGVCPRTSLKALKRGESDASVIFAGTCGTAYGVGSRGYSPADYASADGSGVDVWHGCLTPRALLGLPGSKRRFVIIDGLSKLRIPHGCRTLTLRSDRVPMLLLGREASIT